MARVDLAPKFHGGRPGYSLQAKERVVESPTHPESRILPFWTSFVTKVRGVLGFRGASRPRFEVKQAVKARETAGISGGVQAEERTDFVAGSNGTGTAGGTKTLAQRRVTAASTAVPGTPPGKLRGPFGLTAFTKPGKLTPFSPGAERIFGQPKRQKKMKIAE